MSETDAIFARMDANLDQIGALLQEIMERLDRRRPPDVPLDQRGFGVMEEPPA